MLLVSVSIQFPTLDRFPRTLGDIPHGPTFKEYRCQIVRYNPRDAAPPASAFDVEIDKFMLILKDYLKGEKLYSKVLNRSV